MDNKLYLRQIIILFFIMGLLVSCSTNYTISQLMKLSDIDFDKVEGSRRYVSLNFDDAQAWAEKEIENEYTVLMDFDKNTGERICKSIPKGVIAKRKKQ